MNILCDVDGVLADFTGALLARWNERHGTHYATEDVRDYDIGKLLKDPEWWYVTMQQGFWANLDVLPGAKELIATISNSGLPWAYLTSVKYVENVHAARERAFWLDTHFGDYGLAEEHLAVVLSARAKKGLFAETSIVIDDSPEVANLAAKESAHVLVRAQPWNTGIPNRMTIEEITKYIKNKEWLR